MSAVLNYKHCAAQLCMYKEVSDTSLGQNISATHRIRKFSRRLKQLLHEVSVCAAVDIRLVPGQSVKQLDWVPCFKHRQRWRAEVLVDGTQNPCKSEQCWI